MVITEAEFCTSGCYICYIFICLFIIIILQMLFSSTANKFKQRIREWWNFSFFNRIDLLIIILAITGAVIRIFPQHFIAAKTTYAINCVFLFVRLLRDYSASSYLGPKLVMITKMVRTRFVCVQGLRLGPTCWAWASILPLT